MPSTSTTGHGLASARVETQSNLCTGCFGGIWVWSHVEASAVYGRNGLVSHISVSNMTQRLQGTFYISAQLPVEKLQTVEAAIAQHIRTIQTEPVTESLPVCGRKLRTGLFLAMKHRVSAPVCITTSQWWEIWNQPLITQLLFKPWIPLTSSRLQQYLSPDACGIVAQTS